MSRINGSFTQRATIAAAPLLATKHRKEAVAFTDPFLRMRATVLIRKSIRHAEDMRTLKDIVNRPDLEYGTLDRGIIVRAFRNTNDSLLRKTWRSINKFKPSALTSTNEEGIARVRTQNYAFILPDTIAEYITYQSCDLLTVDKFLLDEGYALALPIQSPWIPHLNKGLDLLRRNGVLDSLYHKWWIQNSKCQNTEYPHRMPRVSQDAIRISVTIWLYMGTTFASCFL